ncbi:MAG: hypothetical protein IJ758_01970 [Clostridia bacterium]|nr:hypothetical protein [Clostridia bacterium]
MPTGNKTTNLQLNSWLSTDKPKREDFVNDNTIIDTILGNHINNSGIHVTEELIDSLSNKFVLGSIVGNGQASKVTTLAFTPKFFIVYLINQPPIKYDSTNGYYLYNFAIGSSTYGSTKGMTINGANVTLSQSTETPSDGVFLNLNVNYGQYIYFAMKP